MDTAWAQERLDVIRTLMERSAVYRRALAPIMLMVGVLGIFASGIGFLLGLTSAAAFTFYWMSISFLALAMAFLLIRKQSMHDQEPFWSPPTRRVAQALIPALFAGAVYGTVTAGQVSETPNAGFLPVPIWMLFYGCAVHAAGFFMPRGMKLFGWIFLLAGGGLLVSVLRTGPVVPFKYGHLLMGAFFGGFHFAYGLYLYFSEKKTNNA
jgi:hypothetical protein